MARMKMTPQVRFALWFLRIYLLVLLGLIVLKFARHITGSGPDQPIVPATEPVQRERK